MGGQVPSTEPVRRSIRNSGRTPPLLDIIGNQIGVPGRYTLAEGRPAHACGVPQQSPPAS